MQPSMDESSESSDNTPGQTEQNQQKYYRFIKVQ